MLDSLDRTFVECSALGFQSVLTLVLALACYALAYLLMLHVLRFMDAFQHTYALFETLEQPPGPEAKQFDAAFEASHTFSNPHSMAHPWLNLLTLNFGYHKAHHAKPNQPWHRLPALNASLFGDSPPQLIPFSNQIACYRRYRVQRRARGRARLRRDGQSRCELRGRRRRVLLTGH